MSRLDTSGALILEITNCDRLPLESDLAGGLCVGLRFSASSFDRLARGNSIRLSEPVLLWISPLRSRDPQQRVALARGSAAKIQRMCSIAGPPSGLEN